MIVRSSGSLAHIYFNVTAERMDVSEIAILYPDLVDALGAASRHRVGVGVETGPSQSSIGPHGTAALTSDRLPPGLAEPEQAVGGSGPRVGFPHSGDLILLGAWIGPGRRVVSFEDQRATHGGPGGPQDYPFFLTPPEAPLDLTRSNQCASALPVFYRTVSGDRGARGEAVKGKPRTW